MYQQSLFEGKHNQLHADVVREFCPRFIGSGGRLLYIGNTADRAEFRKNAADIAWETEVWLADNPDHMIHFNGDRFLGPHSKR